jgi:hypothetical protein
MGAFALPLALAGIGLQVYGQVQSGRQQKKAAQAAAASSTSYAELADYNAAIAELQAEDAIKRGELEEQRFRSQVRGMIGGQRAAFAASNVDVNWGSPLDVQADAAFLGELDALQIRTNASREAWGHMVQAEDYRRRGEILRKEGANALAAGNQALIGSVIGAGTTLLTGAGNLLMQKYGGR